MNFPELKIEENTIKYLANALNNGTLTLFLGAGVSYGYGIPGWNSLVNKILSDKRVGLHELEEENSNPTALQGAVDRVLAKFKSEGLDEKDANALLVSIVQDYLYDREDVIIELESSYDKVLSSFINNNKSKNESITELIDLFREYKSKVVGQDFSVFENKSLSSIVSLLMGSKRGNVKRVITLNFDSMLEWFLKIYGFSIRSISELPSMEGSEDVRIYHPHGFAPKREHGLESSNKLIFGRKEAFKRAVRVGDSWRELTRHLLHTGICLFIGLGPDTLVDPAIGTLLTDSGDLLVDDRPLGVWLAYGNLSSEKEQEFLNNNIIPFEKKTSDDISDFIFSICQQAANQLEHHDEEFIDREEEDELI